MEQIRAYLPELSALVASFLFATLLAILKQAGNALRKYLANKRINDGVENIVNDLLLEHPNISTDALIEATLVELKGEFSEQISLLGATESRLRRIIRSKVVKSAPLAMMLVEAKLRAEEAKDA